MTAAGAHHPQADVDRLYCNRNIGGRGLLSVEECVRREENAMTVFVVNSEDKGILRLKQCLIKERVLMGDIVEKGEDKELREENRRIAWRENRCMVNM